MTRLDWESALWVDGPRLTTWLDRHIDVGSLCERDRKLLQRWRNGSAATVWTVDRVLIAYGRHLSELPDSLWLDDKPRLSSVA